MEGIKKIFQKDAGLEVGDYDDRTGLHLACSEGHFTIVSFLVKEGISNINPLDRWGRTPFDDAITNNHSDIVDLLAQNGGKTGDEIIYNN